MSTHFPPVKTETVWVLWASKQNSGKYFTKKKKKNKFSKYSYDTLL